MAKKVLRSNLELNGIAPNLLLKDIEVTAPFLFKGELNLEGKDREYLNKLSSYKKNLNSLKYINLSEYFYICMAAHWATAGTFVPTNVDNQIREGLWKHKEILGHIEKMAKITIESWLWNYEEVTNRKSFNISTGQFLSTHEGTWLSVAIGAYNALVQNKKTELAQELSQVILAEIDKEEKILLKLRDSRDHINFLRTTALMAHNFGDLDRVIDQWDMPQDDPFRERIYKLGHQLNKNYSPILVFAGQVNKAFLSVENHRHMSMRQAKCLRKSFKFLIPIGPFMDAWGGALGESNILSMSEKGEVVASLFEGYKRQDLAFGYARAFRGLINSLPQGFESLVQDVPFDLVSEIRKSKFYKISEITEEDFLESYKKKLEDFECPLTGLKF
jgi:hypothetical protein